MKIQKNILYFSTGILLSALMAIGIVSNNIDKSPNNETIVKNTVQIELGENTVQPFDIVIIDVDGTIDGKAFDGGSGEALMTMIGSGQMVPGFEAQLIGHQIGDTFDVVVTFPDDYGEATLNGKEAIFKTTLHEIWRNVESDLGENYYNKMAQEYISIFE